MAKDAYIGIHMPYNPTSSSNLFQYDIKSGNNINFSVTTNDEFYNGNTGYEMVFPGSVNIDGSESYPISFPNWGYIGSKSTITFHNGYISLSTTSNSNWLYNYDDSYYKCWYRGYGFSTMLWRQGTSTISGAQYLANGTYTLSVVLDDSTVCPFTFTVTMGKIEEASANFDWGTIGMTAKATYEYQSRMPQCYLYIMPNVGTTLKIRHIELIAGTEPNISFSEGSVARKLKNAYVGVYTDLGPVSSNNLFQYDMNDGSAANSFVVGNSPGSAGFSSTSTNVHGNINFPTWGVTNGFTSASSTKDYTSITTTAAGGVVSATGISRDFWNSWFNKGFATKLWERDSASPHAYLPEGTYTLSIVLEDDSISSFTFENTLPTSHMVVGSTTSQSYDWGTIGLQSFFFHGSSRSSSSNYMPMQYLYIQPNVGTTLNIKHIELISGTEHKITFFKGELARKIKKAYVGVNGVARLCWSK